MQAPIPFSKEMTTSKLPNMADSRALLKEAVDQLLLTQFAPATLLVNDNSDILAIRGQVAPYVSIEPGTPSFNVGKLVRRDLRPTVQTALYRAKKVGKDVQEIVRVEHDGGQKIVNLHVKPIKLSNYEEPFFLILFEEKEKAAVEVQTTKPKSPKDSLVKAKDQQIKELSEDLESTKQTLQTVIVQQEAINEELRSANEEIQSSNEELMSTNEELETSKEELQSANEELTTLNDELRQRNQMLKELNEDLANLMNNVDTAVIIVDRDFKIKRFTASAQELLRLTPEDVEHSILGSRLGIPLEDLEKPLSNVIAKNEVVRTEINAGKDSWYQMRIRPYVTEEKKIGGAVLSFADISEIKTLAHQVKEQADKLAESEMLATVGKTAGMVGHDIRNPLQAIVSDIYLAKTELASTPESDEKKNVLESLQEIEENTEYISKIVADLQDFARTVTLHNTKVNIEETVQDVLSSVTIPKDVAVSYSIAKDFPILILDALYLKRILTNLILNALQAMPKKGKLTVNAFRQDGEAVISIEDTGVGIPDEIKGQIFIPLFTTKSKGQGFGLPVVKKLTEAMGGTVTFESEKGNGAKFILKFAVH
jgi:two-component system CheB/CheR fusion protein